MSKDETSSKSMIFGQMMEYPLTVRHILERARRMSGTREIISKDSEGQVRHYSYKDCYKRVCRLAHALDQLGIHQGDRVGTLSWNSSEHLEVYFAVPSMGAVLHTLNIRLSSEQLSYVINHAEDRVIFVDASLVPLLEKIAPLLSSVEKYVVIGGSPDLKTSLSPVFHYEALLENKSDDYRWPVLDENQAAGLCYTSGTTGNPKGALYSHRSQFLHAMGITMAETLGVRNSDTILAVVPMFHANAWGLPYAAALVGAQLVLPGPNLKPIDLAKMIEEFRVTVAAGVPTLWIGLYQELQAQDYDVGSLRALLVGGAAMPRKLIQAFETEMKISVIHAWGMTELSPLGTCSSLVDFDKSLSPSERFDQKARQGFAAPGIEMRIVADDDSEQPWDGKSQGELQVRGPWVISSYYRDATGDCQFTRDGWFKTGDVAVIDPKGSMAIVDRTKDLIKSGGEWISSVALENALMSHPNVLEAVVIGVSDKKWSERPLALVVPKKGISLTCEELQIELSKSFAKFWVPEKIQFVGEIPKTSVGKFDKKKLRQQFEESSFS